MNVAARRYKYTVRFSGVFPMDMLRHDCAFPADGESAAAIATSLDPFARSELRQREGHTMQTVKLIGLITPTMGRWSSFGNCGVDELSVQRVDLSV